MRFPSVVLTGSQRADGSLDVAPHREHFASAFAEKLPTSALSDTAQIFVCSFLITASPFRLPCYMPGIIRPYPRKNAKHFDIYFHKAIPLPLALHLQNSPKPLRDPAPPEAGESA
jgi:hypothetical protein